MLTRAKKVVCAWVSLVLDKHRAEDPLGLSDVLFKRSEIHKRALDIFETDINDYVIVQTSTG